MEPQHLIPASDLHGHYNIEIQFLQALQEYDLVPLTVIDEALFIDADHLPEVEKIIHLHQELHINLEGIDAIIQLLKRLEKTQGELTAVRNRLRLYEGNG